MTVEATVPLRLYTQLGAWLQSDDNWTLYNIPDSRQNDERAICMKHKRLDEEFIIRPDK